MSPASAILRRMVDNEVVTRIAYDGEALRDGTMDVRDLAPALLAVGDLLQGANRVLNGDKATLAVKVQSDFKTGSFDVGIMMLQGIAMQVVSFFGVDTIRTAKEIAEYIGFATGKQLSVLGLLKWLRGRTPESTTQLDNGKIQIEVRVEGDNNKVEVKVVPSEVYNLASDATVRKAAEGIVKPLRLEGIDSFETKRNARVIERVEKADLPAFALPEPSVRQFENVPQITEVVEIVKPSFAEDLTWTLSDGSGGRFDAVMKDQVFLDRVMSGEDFRIGDLLKVRIETHQSLTASGLRTRREVVEVVEEIKAPRQTPLLPQPKFRQPPLLDGSPASRKQVARKARKPRRPH